MFNTSKNKSSSLVLKPCKSIKQTGEEGLFIKAGQIPNNYSIDTIYQGLDNYLTDVSIENYEIRIFK